MNANRRHKSAIDSIKQITQSRYEQAIFSAISENPCARTIPQETVKNAAKTIAERYAHELIKYFEPQLKPIIIPQDPEIKAELEKSMNKIQNIIRTRRTEKSVTKYLEQLTDIMRVRKN